MKRSFPQRGKRTRLAVKSRGKKGGEENETLGANSFSSRGRKTISASRERERKGRKRAQ